MYGVPTAAITPECSVVWDTTQTEHPLKRGHDRGPDIGKLVEVTSTHASRPKEEGPLLYTNRGSEAVVMVCSTRPSEPL
ncbi:hypothetical protein VTI28DRAFT_379 [Corynascus sepedonium]